MCRIKVYMWGLMFTFQVKVYLGDQSFCIGFKGLCMGSVFTYRVMAYIRGYG